MIDSTIGSRALVLGLGDSGLAMTRHLTARGYAVRVADTRPAPPHLAALCDEANVEFIAGDFSPSLLEDIQMLALSPGLSPTKSAAAPLVKAAFRRKIEVVGEIELFARELARLKIECGYAPQIVGITGTNGKTTTTHLAGLMMRASGKRVELAGNISPAALDALRSRSAEDDLPDIWLLELSSFQLATTRSLVCDAAAVLNVTDDHLDWHESMGQYVADKARIFAAKTVQVLNRDDARTAALAKKNSEVITFGGDAPAAGDAYGIIVDQGIAWLAWAEDVSVLSRRRKASEPAAPISDPQQQLLIHKLMPADALAVRGRHNALNALAAVALARAIGCQLAPMMHALRRYAGEPHRLQLIANRDGVDYYDDSKGTNVGASVAALEGLGAEGKKVVVILGGDGKGQNFSPLAQPIARHARAAILIGRDAPLIRDAIEHGVFGVPLIDSQTLEQAVAIAAEHARHGDAVVLSPACASFDMFRNYVHRGEIFAMAVRELTLEAGHPC